MQGEEQTGRRSCASCRPRERKQKAGSKPQPDHSLLLQPAAKKPRTKRFRVGKTVQASEDIIQLMVPFVLKSPKHLLMLRRVSKRLRDFIDGDHETWRAMLIQWEAEKGRVYQERYRERCMFTIPNIIAHHPWPAAHPKASDWFLTPIPADQRKAFNQHVKQIILLQHSKHCGVCGGRNGVPEPFWSLGMPPRPLHFPLACVGL